MKKTSQFNLLPGINELEMQSFLLCETDDEPGLTMYEFDQCKVRKNTQISKVQFCKMYIYLLQAEFGHWLKDSNIPTMSDFAFFDDNADGILSYEEWLDVSDRVQLGDLLK